jgi:hypothetical protein
MSEQIIQLLIAERDRLDRVIAILGSSVPVDVYDDPTMPDWVKPKAKVAPAPKKKGFSAATRRKMAEGQKRRWAAINAAKAGTVALKAKPAKKTVKATIAEMIAPKADEEFKSAMSAAMKASWAKRKATAKKKG